ncbi:MAG: hypothetical protein AAGB00_08435 [Planctomycetota bacterium]
MTPLLASAWKHLGKNFSGSNARLDTGELAAVVGLFVGLGLLVWLLHWVNSNWREWSTRPNPKRLFQELCRCHGLSRRHRAVLLRLAEAEGLQQPAEVFLLPDLFDLEDLPPELAQDASAMEHLGVLLFDDLDYEYVADEEQGSECVWSDDRRSEGEEDDSYDDAEEHEGDEAPATGR